jgi:hypothetical protein
MEKLDLTKKYKSYFTAKTKPELIDIETANFISICGKGDPSGEDFIKRIETLYPLAYTIKFSSKAKGKDFVVSKLEGLWWFDEKKYPGKTITNAVEVPRSEWEYRLLIRLPDFITEQDITLAKATLAKKKSIPLMNEVKYFSMTEGTCIQMLHVGPYSTEIESLKIIGEFSEQHKLLKNGLHHEIYLSDFRKTAPEQLKTILREPVKMSND